MSCAKPSSLYKPAPTSTNGSTSDLMVVPDARHALKANEDSAILLTVGKKNN